MTADTDSADHFAPRPLPGGLYIRRARVADVAAIRALVAPLVDQRILVEKDHVNYFEALPEFQLVVDLHADGTETLVACAALHVLWTDLAEVRTVATNPDYRRRGVGRALITQMLADARAIGVSRVFCLTFETSFFAGLGFDAIEGTPVSPDVYGELLRSHDEGTAEFLDLARVKPNTLGNTRMIVHLE
jgi:amino-acid N-acetyltransferase